MRLIEWQVEDFMRVKSALINADGKRMLRVGGDNGEGKTSAVRALAWAVGGAQYAPEVAIRRGAKKAEVLVDLGEVKVVKTETKSGPSLTLTGADGETIPRPAEKLKAFRSALTFDPMSFASAPPAEQRATLCAVATVDTSAVDTEREEAFAARTEAKRDLKKAEAVLASLPPAVDAPDQEVSIAAIDAERRRLTTENAEHAERRAALAQSRVEYKSLADRAAEAEEAVNNARRRGEEEIAAARARAENAVETARTKASHAEAERVKAAETGAALAAEVEALVDHDLSSLDAQIAGAQDLNRAVANNRARRVAKADVDGNAAEVKRLDRAIADAEEAKAKILAEAKLPIPGLALTDDGVTYNGLPLSQASTAERTRISVAVGFALHPQLKILWVEHGSELDEKNLALLEQLATEHDGLVIVERVGTDAGKADVVIVDGEVAP
jgi:hypothetical protein